MRRFCGVVILVSLLLSLGFVAALFGGPRRPDNDDINESHLDEKEIEELLERFDEVGDDGDDLEDMESFLKDPEALNFEPKLSDKSDEVNRETETSDDNMDADETEFFLFQTHEAPKGSGYTLEECGNVCEQTIDDLGVSTPTTPTCKFVKAEAEAACDKIFGLGTTPVRYFRGRAEYMPLEQERKQGPGWELCMRAREMRCNRNMMFRFAHDRPVMCRCGACAKFWDLGSEVAQYCDAKGFGHAHNAARRCRDSCFKFGSGAINTATGGCDAKSSYQCKVDPKHPFNSKLCVQIRKAVCGLKKAGSDLMKWITQRKDANNQKNLERVLYSQCQGVCALLGKKSKH